MLITIIPLKKYISFIKHLLKKKIETDAPDFNGLIETVLCVDELLVNIIEHNKNININEKISLKLGFTNEFLLVEITEPAAENTPDKKDFDKDMFITKYKGAGFFFIENTADEFSVENIGGKNIYRFKIKNNGKHQ